MVFEVYTYFGRVVHAYPVYQDETHHRALGQARAYADRGPYWVRVRP
jgi:uncharacterized membrane protein YecN with MAPEG domain